MGSLQIGTPEYEWYMKPWPRAPRVRHDPRRRIRNCTPIPHQETWLESEGLTPTPRYEQYALIVRTYCYTTYLDVKRFVNLMKERNVDSFLVTELYQHLPEEYWPEV